MARRSTRRRLGDAVAESPWAPAEVDFQRAVVDLARALGWTAAHFRAARTVHGWRTAVAADGAGFPDLVLVRERVVFAELKANHGRVARDQAAWHEALQAAGAAVFVWRPRDWDDLERELRRRGAA